MQTLFHRYKYLKVKPQRMEEWTEDVCDVFSLGVREAHMV